MRLAKRLLLGGGLALLALAAPGSAATNVAPATVTIAGSFQSEAGCPADWQPDCATTHLVYDANDDVWQGVFVVPAGSYEYKAALNDSWTENYGLHAQANGSNIPLTLAGAASVKFYYDPKSHWATDSASSVIAVAAGSFQSELGCSSDWDPSCLRSWLEDPDGDGIYTFQTTAIPAGSYETKVAIAESWTENYGAGGTPNGSNIAFSVSGTGTLVTFSYNAATHVLTVFSGAVAVATRSFDATRSRGGVVLRWRTGSEIDTLGFDVYRVSPGRTTRVNVRLIRAHGRPGGGVYTLLDRSRRDGGARYRLESISLDGSRSPSATAVLLPR